MRAHPRPIAEMVPCFPEVDRLELRFTIDGGELRERDLLGRPGIREAEYHFALLNPREALKAADASVSWVRATQNSGMSIREAE
jgi:hypothetical protein